MQVVEVAPGTATVSMVVRADMVNGHGIGHGGLTFTLADTAFAFACNTYNRRTVAQAAEIRFLAPTRLDDVLVARAAERSRQGRDGIYDIAVHAGDDPGGRVRGPQQRDPRDVLRRRGDVMGPGGRDPPSRRRDGARARSSWSGCARR